MKSVRFSSADILCIGIGGTLGSLLRWLLGLGYMGSFPIPTILVNVAGAAALAVLHASQHRLHPGGKYLYMVGFCGSFTTVSLYSYESLQMLEKGQWAMAAANILGPVLLSIGLVATIISVIERRQVRRSA